jgi:hypothetical protein
MPEPSTAELKAYMTGIHFELDGMWEELQLVIAESPEAAARLAYPTFDDERIAEVLSGENSYSVERYSLADSLAVGQARIIRDDKTLRSVGFHYDGERQCEACDEWSEGVCEECYLCSACAATEPDHECDLCGKEKP